MKNVSDKTCTENQNIHFMFNNFFSKNRAVHEVMWKNTVQPQRPKMTKCGTEAMLFACWITMAKIYVHTQTHTHFIRIAFPWQQKLRERASILRYTYMACLACPQKNARAIQDWKSAIRTRIHSVCTRLVCETFPSEITLLSQTAS